MKHRADCELKVLRTPVKREPLNLGETYKACCEETGGRFLAAIAQKLTDKRILAFDMDQLIGDMDQGVAKFLTSCTKSRQIVAWSSLLKLEDIEE